MLYLFCVDYGSDVDNYKVINAFPHEKKIVKRGYRALHHGKQSYNVLEGYREACDLSDSFVFNIEDDIMVSDDFFWWHLNAHDGAKDIFCTIGTRNHNTHTDDTGDLGGWYTGSKTDYQSWGVCFPKHVLLRHVMPHCTDEYYRNPHRYIAQHFPGSSIGQFYVEQDGLIRRVMESSGLLPVFPTVARGYHAGFYSYHRNLRKEFRGVLADKIKRVGEILADPVQYREACGEFIRDSEQVNLRNYVG
jgi:hypothetical protein